MNKNYVGHKNLYENSYLIQYWTMINVFQSKRSFNSISKMAPMQCNEHACTNST